MATAYDLKNFVPSPSPGVGIWQIVLFLGNICYSWEFFKRKENETKIKYIFAKLQMSSFLCHNPIKASEYMCHITSVTLLWSCKQKPAYLCKLSSECQVFEKILMSGKKILLCFRWTHNGMLLWINTEIWGLFFLHYIILVLWLIVNIWNEVYSKRQYAYVT